MRSVAAILDRLNHSLEEIIKAKKYLKGEMQAPHGVKVYTGKRGGRYYLTEDLHESRGTQPKKRMPAFKKDDEGNLTHRTAKGEHGPGTYQIRQDIHGKHFLTFTPKGSDRLQHLGSHADLDNLKLMVAAAKGKESPVMPPKPRQRNMADINADLKDFDILSDKKKYFRRYLERESKKGALNGYQLVHHADGKMELTHPDWTPGLNVFSSDEDLFDKFEGGINPDMTKVLRSGMIDLDKNETRHDQKAYLAWEKKKYADKKQVREEKPPVDFEVTRPVMHDPSKFVLQDILGTSDGSLNKYIRDAAGVDIRSSVDLQKIQAAWVQHSELKGHKFENAIAAWHDFVNIGGLSRSLSPEHQKQMVSFLFKKRDEQQGIDPKSKDVVHHVPMGNRENNPRKKPLEWSDHPDDIKADWVNLSFPRVKQGFSGDEWNEVQNWMRGLTASQEEYNTTGKEIDYDHHRSVIRDILKNTKNPHVRLKSALSGPGKKEPEVLTEEQYLARNGASFMGGADVATHRLPGIKLGSAPHKRIVEREKKNIEENDAKRESLRSEYAEKVKSGEVRPPTREEELRAIASGHDDNPSVQAARRVLAKHEARIKKELAIPPARESHVITEEMNNPYVKKDKRAWALRWLERETNSPSYTGTTRVRPNEKGGYTFFYPNNELPPHETTSIDTAYNHWGQDRGMYGMMMDAGREWGKQSPQATTLESVLSGDRRHNPEQRKIASDLGQTVRATAKETAPVFGVDTRSLAKDTGGKRTRQDTFGQMRFNF